MDLLDVIRRLTAHSPQGQLPADPIPQENEKPTPATMVLAPTPRARLIYGIVFAIGSTVTTLATRLHFVHAGAQSFQVYVVGYGAAFMAAALGFGCVLRLLLKDWQERRLRIRYLWELGLTLILALIAAVSLTMSPSIYEAFGFAVVIAAVTAIYAVLQRSIKRALLKYGRHPGTERAAQAKPFKTLFREQPEELPARSEGEPLEDVAESLREVPVWRFVAWIMTTARDEPFTRIRLLIVIAFVILLGVQVSVAGSETLNALKHAAQHRGGAKHHDKKRKKKNHKKTKLETWNSLCPTLPGNGTPTWAKQNIHDLYLGQNGYGAIEAGCTTTVFVRDGFVYVLAYKQGELQSVAVDSFAYGAAIYLRPAAEMVLALIAQHGALGGPARIDVGAGDLYLIHTSAGTVTLLRDQKHPIGLAQIGTPYAELPPPVTTAWIAAMRAHDLWLWPLEPRRLSADLTLYVLIHSAVTKTFVEDVELSGTTQRAYGQLSGVPGGDWTPYDGRVFFDQEQISTLAALEPKPPPIPAVATTTSG